MGNIGSMKSVDPLIKFVQQETNPKLHALACTSLEKIVKPEANNKELSQCPAYWIAWQKNQNAPVEKKN